mgnify:CR=1 FL=1
MLRTLFMPRLLGLHLLVIGVLVSFTLLGRWQLGVFEDSGRPRAAADPAPVEVTTLTQVGSAFQAEALRRRVTAEGGFDAARQLLVADRTPDSDRAGGRFARGQGYWLLTPLRLADGTMIPVVRGWVATPQDPATAVPEGTVTVTGRLMPPEPTDSVQRTGRLPEGQVATVSTAELINIWTGERLRNGYVIATEQVAGSAPAPKLVAVSPPTQERAFNWRNLAYALQWWIFAGFAVFMWYRLVREAVRERARAAAGDGTGSADAEKDEPAPAETATASAVQAGERPPGAR